MEKREWGSKLNSFQSFEKVACIGYKMQNVVTIPLLIKNVFGLNYC